MPALRRIRRLPGDRAPVQRMRIGDAALVAPDRAHALVALVEEAMTVRQALDAMRAAEREDAEREAKLMRADSPELLDEIADLRKRLDRLERERPRCPTCFDTGWTEGSAPCQCRRKDGKAR